jgi:ribosomal protein S21
MATVVRKKSGQSDDSLIAQFRKKVLNEDIIGEIKEREYYTKPSRKKYEREKILKKLKKRKWQPRTTR